jgi:mRNA interferase RelE/StbE
LSEASKTLSELDRPIGRRIFDKLAWLSENIRSLTPLPLSDDLAGFYKLYIGVYRAIYSVNHETRVISVHKIGHRKDVYGK